MRANSRGLFAAMCIAVYLANALGADEPDPIAFDGIMKRDNDEVRKFLAPEKTER